MQAKTPLNVLIAAGLLLAAPLAGAHEGLHTTGSFGVGFLHPLTGLDHLLVALAAGGWAASGGRRVALRSGMFMLFLLAGVWMPGAAAGLLSLLALAALLSALFRPCYFAYSLFGGLAYWHGMLHMQEMPQLAGTASYIGGLVAATWLLLAGGMLLARWLLPAGMLQPGSEQH